jgi:subtilase family serine protease
MVRNLSSPLIVSLVVILFQIPTFGAVSALAPNQPDPFGASLNSLAIPVASPGYSNGNLAYLENFSNGGGVLPLVGATCIGAQFTLLSFTGSPVYSYSHSTLRATFTLDTECGISPFSVSWNFGDGNVSSQSSANITFSSGGRWYDDFIFNHTYEYIGSFIAQFSATDSANTHISASTPEFVSFTPSLFYSFYNVSGLLSRGVNGSTYSIGIADACIPSISQATYQLDLDTFDERFGLANTTLHFFSPAGPAQCGWSNLTWTFQEDFLDIEWAHVAAPGATIYVCLDTNGPGSNLKGLEECDTSFYQNRTKYETNITSNSWHFCAESLGNSQSGCINGVDPYGSNWLNFEQAGMNMVSGSGDFLPDNACSLANYPASNPYGLAVGGTTVTSVGQGGSYGAETQWANYSLKSLQCYYFAGVKLSPYDGTRGETFGNNTYYAAPSNQSRIYNYSDRYAPDVSLDANTSTGVPVYAGGHWWILGGTSVGTPIWAGILDLLFQAKAPGLSGFALSFLYAHSSCFHEILNGLGGRDGLGTPNVGCLANA